VVVCLDLLPLIYSCDWPPFI